MLGAGVVTRRRADGTLDYLEDANGNRINASWIGQNADRTVGFAIGFSHADTPVQENQVGLYEPWQQIGVGWRPGVPAGTTNIELPW